ncbi:MAG: class I SAM-dependent methyltransferase [Actinomycetia bacterium]|nr:class I SAM-dependent methyltransferase [Actinomycetes bacterium]
MFDGYSIPYDNAHFDLAILSHVIEHVEYPRRLLRKAGRVALYVFVDVSLEDTIRFTRDVRFSRTDHINLQSTEENV